MGLGEDSRRLLLTPPTSGLLLSSVIVGNTHGQLAEIDLRQGEWTREPCRRGRGGRKGKIPSEGVQWHGGALIQVLIAWVQILVHQKL